MHRLMRTKRDTIWTKTPSKPRREHTKVWHKKVVQIISKSKSTHDWGKIKSTNDWWKIKSNKWLIPKHINTWSEISIGIKSNNTWDIRHQLKAQWLILFSGDAIKSSRSPPNVAVSLSIQQCVLGCLLKKLYRTSKTRPTKSWFRCAVPLCLE